MVLNEQSGNVTKRTLQRHYKVLTSQPFSMVILSNEDVKYIYDFKCYHNENTAEIFDYRHVFSDDNNFGACASSERR